ncbi:MAG: LysM peptidoglycan-binding domain-containing protein [Candidatus Manganitrophus sp.]|nr:MAG: LysM peptidoglycan-binding domain-containing protein [Candidatus Manganitrophus sp.]
MMGRKERFPLRFAFFLFAFLYLYSTPSVVNASLETGHPTSVALIESTSEEGTVGAPDRSTPLEEIEEEEHLPEDFFDLLTLELPPDALPFSMQTITADPSDPSITYDVPIVFNELVNDYIVFFQTRLRDKFELWLARSGQYTTLMRDILREHQLPEDLVFLSLIESGFNPKAFSRAKAAGPWQFIKGTGKKYGLRIDDWIDERRDPVKSTVAAAKYLRDLYGLFGSWPLSMASYNAGEGRIMRAMARTKAEDFWELKQSHHIRLETKNYVPKYMAATMIARNPQKYGFSIEYHPPFTYDEVEIPNATALRTIAKAAGVTVAEIKAYNPELKKESTPPRYPRYRLKLPQGTRETFLANFSPNSQMGPKSTEGQRHRISKGETVSSIARMYDVSIESILQANGLSKESTIRTGDYLIIPTEKHRISTGETLSSIARKYNVSVGSLLRANHLRRNSTIQAGHYLIIPTED